MPEGFKQVQTQSQQQVQTLSPQQILVVKLLELPTVELEDRVRSEVLENPALEEGKDEAMTNEDNEGETDYANEETSDESDSNEYNELDDYLSDDDIPDYKLQEYNRERGEVAEDIPFSDSTSFYETLKEQLHERELSERDLELGEYLIGSLDDDGLLRKPLSNISDELAIYMDIEADVKTLERILKLIQDFDPAGVGARTLQECLYIQLKRKEDSPLKDIELKIIDKCYDEFTRKRWDKIKTRLNLSDGDLKSAITEITKLNPKPGASLGEAIGKNFQQIIPDFIVETLDDGSINLSLNTRNTPQLHINKEFRDMMEEHTTNKANQNRASKEAFVFLKQKVDAAQNFINAIKQRQHTLLITMQAIIDMQKPFFQEGDESLLRPMILKDIADRTHLDISTISRVSNSKYVQTNFGIFPLKMFFIDSYTTQDGEELSIRKIRNALQELVDGEDKKNPYTDDELAAMLKEKGYPVARRTVAKYRQQLNIPVARLRR
jgi:RNA polymerase sigma-54 factor